MLHLHIVKSGVEFYSDGFAVLGAVVTEIISWVEMTLAHELSETNPFLMENQGMKKLLILTFVGMLLAGSSGCKFFECLFRGGPEKTCPQTPVIVSDCNPCGGTIINASPSSCGCGTPSGNVVSGPSLPGPAPTTYTPNR
jgi:hypothetical protein